MYEGGEMWVKETEGGGGGKEWKQELRLWALLSKSRLQVNGEKQR